MKITIDQYKRLMSILDRPFLYPGCVRKSRLQRFIDNFKWWAINGRVNEDDNLYGIDLVGVDWSTFLTHRQRIINMDDARKKFKYDQLLNILDNKYLFALFCQNNNLPHPTILEFYSNGKREILVEGFLQKHLGKQNIFCKQTTGCGGYNVKCIKNKEQLDLIRTEWSDKEYILQEGVTNDSILSSLNNKSLNTIRCVTLSDGEKISVFAAVLRCGTSDSGDVDNVSSGGIVIGIDDSGKLMKWGHYGNPLKEKCSMHPDSNIEFLGFEIPHFKDAINTAIRAHQCIKDVPSIGWDVAITESGTILIEGNYDWGLQIMQMCHGGLKKQWDEFVKVWK